MSFFDIFAKKPTESKTTYTLRAELHPYRIPANTSDFVDLEISVSNNSTESVLTSILINVPRGLGFEQSAISQKKEMHLGQMEPKTVKQFKLRIYGTIRTQKGMYPVSIYALSHYQDYSHMLNEVKKTVELRVD